VIPFVVEAWTTAQRRDDDGDAIGNTMNVNRTPSVPEVEAWRSGGRIRLRGCGLSHNFDGPAGQFGVTVNLTVPFCPVTTDGKEPDLSPFVNHIAEAVKAATRRAKTALPKMPQAGPETSHEGIVLRYLAEGVAKASGDGQFQFNHASCSTCCAPTFNRRLASPLSGTTSPRLSRLMRTSAAIFRACTAEDLAQAVLALRGGLGQERQVGRDQRPLLIADVGRVGAPGGHPARTGAPSGP
jgi:hypothetical protein